MKEVYACIWRSSDPDESFNPEEFQQRIPRLMEWLRSLKAGGHLLGCGGGGFENHAGGLTLILADSPEHAKELSSGTPMNEIGTTEILLWDVFYADLVDHSNVEKLES